MYYKLGQACVTNWGSIINKIRASVVTNWGSYYKLGKPLLQNRTAITNWGRYYRLGKLLQIGIEEVKNIFKSVDSKKATQKDDIKTNLLKKNVDFFVKWTWDDTNNSIRSSKFPNELKQADIVTAHKKVKAF